MRIRSPRPFSLSSSPRGVRTVPRTRGGNADTVSPRPFSLSSRPRGGGGAHRAHGAEDAGVDGYSIGDVAVCRPLRVERRAPHPPDPPLAEHLPGDAPGAHAGGDGHVGPDVEAGDGHPDRGEVGDVGAEHRGRDGDHADGHEGDVCAHIGVVALHAVVQKRPTLRRYFHAPYAGGGARLVVRPPPHAVRPGAGPLPPFKQCAIYYGLSQAVGTRGDRWRCGRDRAEARRIARAPGSPTGRAPSLLGHAGTRPFERPPRGWTRRRTSQWQRGLAAAAAAAKQKKRAGGEQDRPPR